MAYLGGLTGKRVRLMELVVMAVPLLMGVPGPWVLLCRRSGPRVGLQILLVFAVFFTDKRTLGKFSFLFICPKANGTYLEQQNEDRF